MPVGSIIDLMQDMQMVAWFGVQSRIESAGAEGLTDDDPAKSKWDASDEASDVHPAR